MLEALSPTTLSFLFLALGYFLIRYLNSTDQPKIKGLPEIPGVPLFGNLLQLGQDHARVTAAWAKKYGWPVFQTRLGNRRIIWANSFDSVKHFWIANQSSLISRPTLYTFHSVVSSSQGFTIGTSPWDESCKRRRKVAATALNKPAVQSYMPFIDLESCVAIRDMYKDCMDGTIDLDPRKYFHRFALNTSLTLNYGIRIDGGIDQELLREGKKMIPQRSRWEGSSMGYCLFLCANHPIVQSSMLNVSCPTSEAHPTTGRITFRFFACRSSPDRTSRPQNTGHVATSTSPPSWTC